MRTRTEITVETDRWVVVQRQRRSDWCSACLRQVEMLNIDDAAIFAPDGLLLICPHSLHLGHEKEQKPQN